jgi:UDPglucose 6-dehydrogenase
MKVESAEMTKHALNAFLATSVVFINELAVLCEHVGANANEVEQGLKSEVRIGKKAYLRPGSAFDGGTLARDLTYLVEKEIEYNLSSIFFSSILQSNESHKSWVVNKISEVFLSLKDKKIGILGLTYKPGTNTLRRSTAIERTAAVSFVDRKVYVERQTTSPERSSVVELLPRRAYMYRKTSSSDRSVLVA